MSKTMYQALKEISAAENLTEYQKAAISYGANCVRYLEQEAVDLAADKRKLGNIIDGLRNQIIQLEGEKKDLKAANALLETRVNELEEKMADMRTLEEVHQIIQLKVAGVEVQIEYWTPEQDGDPYVYRPTW